MKNPGVRIGLMLLAVAGLGVAGFQGWRIQQDRTIAAAAARQADDRLRGLMLVVTDIRAHQQAYVAAGQGSAFWAAKVTQLLALFDKQAAELRRLVRSADGQHALDEAAGAIDTFRKMDLRAGEYARGGQELLASDLIFTDGFETTASAMSQIDAARTAEVIRYDAESQALLRGQVQWLGGAAALCLVVLLALAPRVGAASPAAELTPAQPAQVAPVALDDESAATLVKPRAAQVPDWPAAAEVCAGLARVLESAELTALLGRAAQVLDAAGVIVWVADRSGAELRPALAHGYSNQTLARMGIIPRDGHNAVAAAYRSGSVRTVTGDDWTNGAIVAPIVSPGGCLGVLAAEVRRGGETNDEIKALAMVLASQLGTLVSSVPGDAGITPAQSMA